MPITGMRSLVEISARTCARSSSYVVWVPIAHHAAGSHTRAPGVCAQRQIWARSRPQRGRFVRFTREAC